MNTSFKSYLEFNYIVNADSITDAYTGEVIKIETIPKLEWTNAPFETIFVSKEKE